MWQPNIGWDVYVPVACLGSVAVTVGVSVPFVSGAMAVLSARHGFLPEIPTVSG